MTEASCEDLQAAPTLGLGAGGEEKEKGPSWQGQEALLCLAFTGNAASSSHAALAGVQKFSSQLTWEAAAAASKLRPNGNKKQKWN